MIKQDIDYVYVNDKDIYHKESEDFNGAHRNEDSRSGQRRDDDDTNEDEPPSYPKEVGDSLADLSPEDIDIVAAMGDALPAGRGLWEATDVEFRGAAFPIGGDANIDGLVTIPNILLQFNERLEGVSHGMGKRDRLPDYQLNVAESNTETENLPEQAAELVRRLRLLMPAYVLQQKWTLVTIATGTEEFCNHCDTPSHSSIRRALGILRKGIPKAFVVLLGPVHVAWSYKLDINLLKPRCPCLESISMRRYRSLVVEWREVFFRVQNEFNSLNHTTFGVLAIPRLPIHSREPESLLVPGRPVLNRKGHTYAAKWLWNRLMTGPSFNFSNMVFSEDSYYCPSVGCPYFRTVQNLERCSVLAEDEYQRIHATTIRPINGTVKIPHRVVVRNNLVEIIALVVFLCLISVRNR
ncbi:GDSL-like protein [Ancylostoma ceylanicum]|uniref:GDSL-like protein n=1 Tax=Ancylostoma ceylanicum TaxID=53326 RepID=A0A0D6M4L6_9BILA|nr:GDSL-like protein [Ancylostoma ceylanicum]